MSGLLAGLTDPNVRAEIEEEAAELLFNFEACTSSDGKMVH